MSQANLWALVTGTGTAVVDCLELLLIAGAAPDANSEILAIIRQLATAPFGTDTGQGDTAPVGMRRPESAVQRE